MKDKTLWWILGGLAALALIGGGGYVTYTHFKQRGIRNNNPGNLKLSTIAWKGKVPNAQNTDGVFEQFADAGGVPGHVWGIRAMYMDVRGDVFRDGLDTIRKLINTYAPPSENSTVDYINSVAKQLGKSPDATLTASDMLPLLKAITKHENGVNPYPDADFAKAMSLA